MVSAMTGQSVDVMILGAGPAGVTLALKLTALGYAVAVMDAPRPMPPRLEGWSARVIEGLRRAGAENALAALGPEVPRQAIWNGQASARNTETLVERARIADALKTDLQAADIPVLNAPGPCRVTADARGRRARRPAGTVRGPKTVALSGWYKDAPKDPATLVESTTEGWVWAARDGAGRAFVQVSVDAHHAPLKRAAHLQTIFVHALRAAPAVQAFLKNGAPASAVSARDAGAVLTGGLVEDTRLRLGDAAFALDPLSGHGVFEAVGGALAAAAVVHTLLTKPQNTDLARRFYEDRARGSFWHHAQMGQAFYAAEERWADAPFWHVRRAWPHDASLPAPPAKPKVVRRPVVVNDFIEERDVIITTEQPRGVFVLAGVPVAEFSAMLQTTPALTDEQAALHFKVTPSEVAAARAWLRREKMV